MARITWSFEAHVDAEPDAVYAWLTDYREDDHSNEAFRRGARGGGKRATRHVISKDTAGAEIVDEWGAREVAMRVRFDPEARAVHVDGLGAPYRAVWVAERDGDGTRVTVDGAFEARGLLALFVPFMRKSVAREMQRDFDGHLADLRGDFAATPRQEA